MRTLMNRINLKLLIYTFLILLVCRIDIVFANEPIATIGRPHPEKHAFIDNNTILRVVPTHIEVVRANTGEVIDKFGNLDFSSRRNIAISPNASQVFVQNYSSVSKRRTIKILDINVREQIAEWEIEGYIDAVAISPTQPMLATSIDDEIHLWNLQTGENIGTMVGERRPSDTCYYVNGRWTLCLSPARDFASVFTPDGRFLIVASQRPDIELWNVETLELEGHFEGHAGNWVNGVVISPDGAYLASYDREQPTVYLWNMKTRELMWKTQTDRRRIADLEFSQDSQDLYVARSRAVERWNVNSGELIDSFSPEFRSFLQTITVSPDGKKALLFYLDGEILWDIENKQILNMWTDFITYWYQNEIELSPDGKTVLSMSGSFIKSWDVSSQQMRLLIPSEDYTYNTIAISHDSQKFAVGKEPLIEIRDLHTGKVETQFPHSFLLPENMTFSSSGKWLAVKGHWGHVDILNTDLPENKQRLEPPFKLQLPGGHYPIGFSENDQYFATSGHTKIDDISKYWIMLWERVEDTFVFKYAWLGGFASDPIFMTTEDGSTLLAGNGRDGIHVWKLLDDKPLLLSSVNGDYPLQFSADGRYLFSYSDDKFQIWDWKRSRLINQSPFPWYESISRDGTLLLTHDIHGQYLIWDLTHMLSFLPYSVEPNGKEFVTLGQIKRNQLMQNFPNPFNPETWIPFKLADESTVTIDIHSSTGELIRSLSAGRKTAGDYSNQSQAVHWDGKNNDGEPVSSGIYFYTINAGDFSATRKMLIQK